MDNVTAETFNAEVRESDLPVLVDFWAPWCAPCKVILPHLETVAEENAGKLRVVKVNIQDEIDIAKAMGIRNIPALFVFKDGEVVAEKFGAAGGLKALRDLVEPHV